MTEEFKWRIGVDTEPASKSFDDLTRKATEADDALAGIVQSLERLEAALQNLNKIGASGLDALASIQTSIEGGFAGVETKLSGVLGRLTQLINISREAAQSQSSSWGQGATAVERYSERVAKASLELTELRQKSQQLGEAPVVGYGAAYGEGVQTREGATVAEMYPGLEEYNRALSQFAQGQVSFAEQSADANLRVQQILNAQNTEVLRYVKTLEQIEATETKLAHLTELEARARKETTQATIEQAAAMPESKTAAFFTERTETEWTSRYGFGEMTGFEQSLLRVLTTFDQLQSYGKETQLTFSNLLQALEQLGAMRFTSVGTSLRVNIRTRLEESVAAAGLLITTLEKLNAMQMGEMPSGREVSVTEPVAPRTRLGYWTQAAGAPTAQVVTQVTTISEEVAKVWDKAPEGAERAMDRIYKVVANLKNKLIGDPLVIDMVNEINMWLSRIGGMGSLQGIEGIGQKFLDVQREMQQASLLETGGLPGFGEQRQEVITGWIEPYREMLGQAQAEMAAMMQEAGPSQWQQYQFPTGQVGMVPPSFIMQQSQKEMTEYEARIRTLTSSEGELSDVAHRVADSIMAQSKVTRTKIDLLRDLSRGTISAEEAEQQLADMTKEAEKSTEKASALSNRFLRHITWIFQGIVIWGGIRAVRDMGAQFVETFGSIEMSAVHAAFVVEQSVNTMLRTQQEYSQAATPYGAGPAEAAPVLPIAERYGMADPRVAEMAAQLSLVTMEEMSMADATDSLLSIMRQWNIGMDDSTRVLDTLATMYATTPGDMKEFMDLMREGPALAQQMGQSFEDNMLLISRAMSYLPGRTATTVSGTLGRILSRVYRQDAARKLAQEYGISVFDPETLGRRPGLEVLDEIAVKFQEIRSESERAALAEMIAGTRQGQAWRDAYVMLENWTTGIRDVQTEMRNWDELIDGVKDTHVAATKEMSASWQSFLQVLGQTTGIVGAIDSALRTMAEGFQQSTREMTAMQEASSKGFEREELYQLYRLQTGKEPTAPAYTYGKQQRYPQMTGDFLDWLDDFMASVSARMGGTRGRGYAAGVRERTGVGTFGEFRSNVETAADRLARKIAEAGQNFETSVKDGSEDLRKTLLTTMLATGWAPGTGVVDLSKYSMAEINNAMRQSRVDTQRMVGAYREFLQGQGYGGEALDEAMQNFMNKLILQLQFFRLPGGQIRLMEGRDLLFYLSKIEENTRPLEGIWNVPEGMRVWVPIESTFYGEWRQRQGEGEGEGGEVELDASAFDQAVNNFGSLVGEFGSGVTAWMTISREYPSLEEGGTVWDQRMRDYFAWMDFLVRGPSVDPDRPYMGYVGAGERSGINFDLFGQHVDRFGVAADTAANALGTGVPNWVQEARTREERNREAAAELRAQPPAQKPELYLPTIMRGIMQEWMPSWGEGIIPLGAGDVDVKIPEPLNVTVPVNETAQGTALGMMNTGMPTSMSTMSLAMSAMTGSISTQLYYLMLIAMNTAQPTVVNVTTDGGTTTTSSGGGGGSESPLMYEYLMSPLPGTYPT